MKQNKDHNIHVRN